MKHFTDRIQSKINKILHSPDPVQPKSSPIMGAIWWGTPGTCLTHFLWRRDL